MVNVMAPAVIAVTTKVPNFIIFSLLWDFAVRRTVETAELEQEKTAKRRQGST
ncbi:hypothetical protein [Bradyrhizobium sp. SK17]|uniref:hypothetical protein n=1 Tax=Bradyrhizobium sp. SK17 TaxID=2057741 RepID=UPI00143DB871|nr:hypothetical protein [Bradyrhizobium sp. SK17]